ncbi:hypothetical protein ACOMHN_010767 [Nucella lapillus]
MGWAGRYWRVPRADGDETIVVPVQHGYTALFLLSYNMETRALFLLSFRGDQFMPLTFHLCFCVSMCLWSLHPDCVLFLFWRSARASTSSWK